MRAPFLALLLIAVALAGCSGKSSSASEQPPGGVADSTTGTLRGVIVDQALHPLKGAFVNLPTAHRNVTTGTDGAFRFVKLTPGTYLIRASRPGYDDVQTSAEVVAGVAEPKAVSVQLTRLASGDPYMITTQFNGFIACSAGVPSVGSSEECGAGAGVPCQVPEPVGCQRVGGQDNNAVQNDFHVDSGQIKTIVVEQVWDSTAGSTTSGTLRLLAATELSCDPECGYTDKLGEKESGSPLMMRIDNKVLKPVQSDPSKMISTFVWAGTDGPNVALDQSFQQFVTFFYGAEAPAGWSFVGGSPNPF